MDQLKEKLPKSEKVLELLRYFEEKYNEIIKSEESAEKMCVRVNWCEEMHLRLVSTPLSLGAIAEEVNSSGLSWKAEVSERFKNMTVDDARSLMGTVVDPD